MRLDGADEFRRAARRRNKLGRVHRVVDRVVVVLFPIHVVQKAHDAPEFLVFRVEFAREIAHGLLDGFAVLNMELVFVVVGQQSKRRVARNTCMQSCHGIPPQTLEGPCFQGRFFVRPC